MEDRFQKLQKFEIKPILVNVTFTEVRFQRIAEVYVKGMLRPMRAKGSSDSFHTAIELCMRKIERQMEREKSRIKNHRGYERTTEYLLEEQLRLERLENKKAA